MSNHRHRLNFRVDDELYAELTAAIGESGGSASLVARNLLRAGLKTPKLRAIAAEITFSTLAIQQRAMNKTLRIVQDSLPQLIAEEMRGMG